MPARKIERHTKLLEFAQHISQGGYGLSNQLAIMKLLVDKHSFRAYEALAYVARKNNSTLKIRDIFKNSEFQKNFDIAVWYEVCHYLESVTQHYLEYNEVSSKNRSLIDFIMRYSNQNLTFEGIMDSLVGNNISNVSPFLKLFDTELTEILLHGVVSFLESSAHL